MSLGYRDPVDGADGDKTVMVSDRAQVRTDQMPAYRKGLFLRNRCFSATIAGPRAVGIQSGIRAGKYGRSNDKMFR